MNLFFYLGIERVDLGNGVAIEFIGPICVAAATTRIGAQQPSRWRSPWWAS